MAAKLAASQEELSSVHKQVSILSTECSYVFPIISEQTALTGVFGE
jgi:hypothetical protein